MVDVLDKLKKARNSEKIEETAAEKSAREAVSGEIAILKSQMETMRVSIEKAEAESEAAKRALLTAEDQRTAQERRADRLEKKAENLEQTNVKNAQALDDSRINQADALKPLQDQLETERDKSKGLEVMVAELKGQMIAAKLVPAAREPIPDFEFIPNRGPDGRTLSVTAKAIRSN
ncbi:MAG: hypothetical protein KAV87_68190 [Desulfobacteraceae bacterium]|nr:hypothetical protein [Desulfobacteraceae bacterium]